MSPVVCLLRNSQVPGTLDLEQPQKASRPMFLNTVPWDHRVLLEQDQQTGLPRPPPREASLQSGFYERGIPGSSLLVEGSGSV